MAPDPVNGPSSQLMNRKQWLRKLGFKFHPFQYEAADEREGDPHLDNYLIGLESKDYLGFLRAKRTTLLFGCRGCGKSAHRIQLKSWCDDTLQRPDQGPNILAVRHQDLDRVLKDISLESHCEAILHRAIQAFLDVLFPDFYERLEELEAHQYEALAWFVQKYSSLKIPGALAEQLKGEQQEPDRELPPAPPVLLSKPADMYNLSAIRELLEVAFTSKGLQPFLTDRPLFRPVLKEVAPSAAKSEIVAALIEYAETQLLFEELLSEVEKVNPRQYDRFRGRLYRHHPLSQDDTNTSAYQHPSVRQTIASAFKGLPSELIPEIDATLAQLFTYLFPQDPRLATSPLELLQAFVEVVRAVGIDHVFILVDRVDEYEKTRGKPEKQAKLLEPLLANIPVLNIAHFKFFLPLELRPHLCEPRAGAEPVLRGDKIPDEVIDWQDTDLATLLEARLRAASDSRWARFTDLVEPEDKPWDVDARLVSFAYHCPRDLVRLCRDIIDSHTQPPTEHLYITEAEIQDALRAFAHKRATELYGKNWLAQIALLPRTEFDVLDATLALGIPWEQAEMLLGQWEEKDLIERMSPYRTRVAPGSQYTIADPRVRLLLEEKRL